MNRRLAPSLLVAFMLLAVPASAPAKIKVAVGIGDQSPRMFTDANWKALKLTKARYFVEWNTIDQPAEIAKADAYVMAARAAKVKVLMHISVDDINSTPRTKLPSVKQYKSKVGALVRRYKAVGVKDWGTWNEANHKSQPTNRNPKRAAQFYKTMRSICKGCKIVALDVLDQSGVETYISRWFRYAGSAGKKSIVIGIHNYSEVNRKLKEKRSKKSLKKYPGTLRIVKAALKKNKRAKFWYTETGGVKKFGSFGCSDSRQKSTTSYMFSLAKKYDRYIERLYSYNWYGIDCQGFDSGLVDQDGSARPAYSRFKSKLKTASR